MEKNGKKYAVFSLDIEEWYHLDYFNKSQCNVAYSMLDGVEEYLEILARHNIPSTFFIVGEIVKKIKSSLQKISSLGYDIGSHGWSHKRPISMSFNEFENELLNSRKEISDAIGKQIYGFRAPCFSIDRDRIDIVKSLGFQYDSSKINFGAHPLYKNINMVGYDNKRLDIYNLDDFFIFSSDNN